MLGETGSGKSSICNAILGGTEKRFKEGRSLSSITETCQIEVGQWPVFESDSPEHESVSEHAENDESGDNVVLMDLPGSSDSKGRDAQFLRTLVELFSGFPRNRLRLVLVAVSLLEAKADSRFAKLVAHIEMMLGKDRVWPHVVFVFTQSNRMAESDRAGIDERIAMWMRYFRERGADGASSCHFEYGNPASLEPCKRICDQLKSFTPKVSESAHTYLESNPGASIDDVIANIESFKQLQQEREAHLQGLIDEQRETLALIEANKAKHADAGAMLAEYAAKVQALEDQRHALQHVGQPGARVTQPPKSRSSDDSKSCSSSSSSSYYRQPDIIIVMQRPERRCSIQ
jgi:hypothetical protein